MKKFLLGCLLLGLMCPSAWAGLTLDEINRNPLMLERAKLEAERIEAADRAAALVPKNSDGYPKKVSTEIGITWDDSSEKDNFPKELLVYPPVVEDPDWYYPRPGSNEEMPDYAGHTGLGSGYLTILDAALKGNPLAMVDLITQTEYAPDRLAVAFPQFPPAVRTMKFWQDWAARYTSPGWSYSRLGSYDISRGRNVAAYSEGAKLGDPQSMFKYATGYSSGEAPIWLTLAAEAGWGPAALELSSRYKYGRKAYGYVIPVDIEKKKHYIAIAMKRGNRDVFMDAAYDAVTGFQGTPEDLENAYVNAYIFHALFQTEDGLLLVERPLAPLDDIPKELFTGWLYGTSKSYSADPKEREDFLDRIQKAKAKTASFAITPEQNARVKQKAYEWLLKYKTEREEELRVMRARRALLTQELRKELASVVDYIEKVKAGKNKAPSALSP